MRLTHKHILIAALISGHTMAQGQTLTNASNSPLPGDVFGINFALAEAPVGPAGLGQTWDYSFLDAAFSDQLVTAAASVSPGAASFPLANIAFVDSDTEYFRCDDTGWWYYGTFVEGETQGFVFQDAARWLAYPCAFGTQWTDAFEASYGGVPPMTRSGTLSGLADAAGTLIMPYGTVTNVLRVRLHEQFTDMIGGSPEVHDLTTYRFYTPGVRYPLLEIGSGTIDGIPIEITAWHDGAGLGIADEVGRAIGVEVMPNPASHQAMLQYSANAEDMELQLINTAGEIVRSERLASRAAGITQQRLDLAGITPGLYCVLVNASNGQYGAARFVVL